LQYIDSLLEDVKECRVNKKSYHHGDLRAALIQAALDVMKTEGPAALSLRSLARAVGVSSMAPYHHFSDRAELLVAVATEGFERLQASKQEIQATQPNVRAALAAGGANYVRFILDNPNLYRLMRSKDFSDRVRYPALNLAASAPAISLRDLMARLVEEQGLSSNIPSQGALLLWGLSHGIGMLALDGQIRADIAPNLAYEGSLAMVDGWIASEERRQ
jgi:AcrR family transcriptional regulator